MQIVPPIIEIAHYLCWGDNTRSTLKADVGYKRKGKDGFSRSGKTRIPFAQSSRLNISVKNPAPGRFGRFKLKNERQKHSAQKQCRESKGMQLLKYNIETRAGKILARTLTNPV